jgi:hypothetical protein
LSEPSSHGIKTTEVSILQAREIAGKVVFDQMISDKLVELASKESELETLRMLCNSEPVTTELAELHEALREFRKSKLEYLRLAEDSFALLQRADERQAQAEHEMHTAKITQTFTDMEKQGAEECHESLKERIVELESEPDQAFEERNLALADMSNWQREGGARDLSSRLQGIHLPPLPLARRTIITLARNTLRLKLLKKRRGILSVRAMRNSGR